MSPLDNVFKKKNQIPYWIAEHDVELALGPVSQRTSSDHPSTPSRAGFPTSIPPSPSIHQTSPEHQFYPSLERQSNLANYFSRRPTIRSSPPELILQRKFDGAQDDDSSEMGIRLPSPTSFSIELEEIGVQNRGLFQTIPYNAEGSEFVRQTSGVKDVISKDTYDGDKRNQRYWEAMLDLEESKIRLDSTGLELESDPFTKTRNMSRSSSHIVRPFIETKTPVQPHDKRLASSQRPHESKPEYTASNFFLNDQRTLSRLKVDAMRRLRYNEVVGLDTVNGDAQSDHLTQPLQKDDVSYAALPSENMILSNQRPEARAVRERETASGVGVDIPHGINAQSALSEKLHSRVETRPWQTSGIMQPFAHASQIPVLGQYAWSPCASDDGMDQGKDQVIQNLGGEDSTFDDDSMISTHAYRENRKPLDSSPRVKLNRSRLAVSSSKVAGDLHLSGRQPSTNRIFLSNENLGHISGFLSDGSSSRPMSEKELRQTLSELVKCNMRASSSFASISHTRSTRPRSSSRDMMIQTRRSISDPIGDLTGQAGPGSSQTTSSVPAEQSIANVSSRKGRAGFLERFSSSRFRSPTPPLLFGKRSRKPKTESMSSSGLSMLSTNSRLARASYPMAVTNDRYKIDLVANSGDQDWVTETDIKTNPTMKVDVVEEDTGSSLADNSDPGSFLPRSRSDQKLGSRHGLLHCPPHARYNHSWTLQKNIQTGEIALLPGSQCRDGTQLLSVNTVSPLRFATNPGEVYDYQHPMPLRQGHSHPFSSSPPVLAPLRYSPAVNDNGNSLGQDKHKRPVPLQSQTSQDTIDIKHIASRRTDPRKAGNVSKARQAALAEMQKKACFEEGSSPLSSTWLTTVDDNHPKISSHSLRVGSFGRTTTLGSKGNLTGTCDGAGMRDAGSSLADGSSPGVKFSSSPLPITTSTPTKAYHDWDDYSDALSFPSLSEHHFSTHIQSQKEDRYQDYEHRLPTFGSSKRVSATSSHQICSSCEDDGISVVSPPAAKISNLPWSTENCQTRRYAARLLSGEIASVEQDPKSDMRHPENGTDSLSCRSMHHSQTGNMLNKILPLGWERFVLGSPLPWNRQESRQNLPSPQSLALADLNPVPRPRSTVGERPIANTDTPQLHRIPRPESPELVGYHKHLSRLYLLPCFVPFLGVLYGHGMFDCVIVWHTQGKIEHFRKQEKVFMLAWSYCIMIFIIAGLILAAILCSG